MGWACCFCCNKIALSVNLIVSGKNSIAYNICISLLDPCGRRFLVITRLSGGCVSLGILLGVSYWTSLDVAIFYVPFALSLETRCFPEVSVLQTLLLKCIISYSLIIGMMKDVQVALDGLFFLIAFVYSYLLLWNGICSLGNQFWNIPSKLMSICEGIVSTINWICNFIVAHSFLSLIDALGTPITFMERIIWSLLFI